MLLKGRELEGHCQPISVSILPLPYVPCPSDLCGLGVCWLFSELRRSRKFLHMSCTVPLGLCTGVIALLNSCFPLVLKTGRVTECPQGGSPCHQVGGIPLSSHPQHSWHPGLVSPALPGRTECLAGGSQPTCVLSPSRPHRAHLSCSPLESHGGSLLFLKLCSGTLEHRARKSTILTRHKTKQNPKPTSEARRLWTYHLGRKNVYLILDENILPYLWREETIK